MDSNTTLVIETLRRWPGVDDDQLAKQAGIEPRQTVNQICRRLEKSGRLIRATGPGGKIVNTLVAGFELAPPTVEIPPATTPVNGVHNFQRIGAVSNAHAGRDFEEAACAFFGTIGIALARKFAVPVGYEMKRPHEFDLGSEDPPILVECKSYTWTTGGNSPSAKLRAMNEVMLFFTLAPPRYRKILFLLRHLRGEISLAQNYIKNYRHMVAPGIEIWEFDPERKDGQRLI